MRPALLDRLVQDAESLAAGGQRREGYALLRWAATACAPDALPAVLVTYHRMRAAAATPGTGEPVETDALGFPAPRFARRAPEPDLHAFVPSTRFSDVGRSSAAGPGEAGRKVTAPPALRPPAWQRPAAALAVVAAVGLLAGAWPGLWRGAGSPGVNAAAMAAVRLGAPRIALKLVAHADPADSRAGFVRGLALLSAGDTAAAAAELVRLAAAQSAEAEDVADGARELARLPGHDSDAADAYLAAVRLGLDEARWSEAEAAMEHGGKAAEAGRLRAMRAQAARQ